MNHRFLEIVLRTPSALFPMEMDYKKKITERFKRGRIEVFIKFEGEGADTAKVNLNMEIARGYFNVLNRLREEFDLESPVTLKTLTAFRDIFTPPAETEIGSDFLCEVEKSFLEALKFWPRCGRGKGLSCCRICK